MLSKESYILLKEPYILEQCHHVGAVGGRLWTGTQVTGRQERLQSALHSVNRALYSIKRALYSIERALYSLKKSSIFHQKSPVCYPQSAQFDQKRLKKPYIL